MVMRLALLIAVLPVLAACGSKSEPPAEAGPYADAPPDARTSAVLTPGAARRPGTGPTSFVGRWAAEADWCVHPRGPERPIEITPIRFEGYENSCHIFSIDETATGYQALLQCVSDGARRDEHVRFKVSDQTLTLTWLDRGGTSVDLRRCVDADAPTPTP